MTVLIAANPVMAVEPSSLVTVLQVGAGLDGVPVFGDAQSVLDTGHRLALHTRGGHITLTEDGGGPVYHYHFGASCSNLPACLMCVVAKDNSSSHAASGLGATNL
jgi:hypothetical protein